MKRSSRDAHKREGGWRRLEIQIGAKKNERFRDVKNGGAASGRQTRHHTGRLKPDKRFQFFTGSVLRLLHGVVLPEKRLLNYRGRRQSSAESLEAAEDLAKHPNHNNFMTGYISVMPNSSPDISWGDSRPVSSVDKVFWFIGPFLI